MRHVLSYWIEKMPNGIIHLLVNTSGRWLNYHEYCDGEYLISDKEEEGTTECRLIIPKDKFQFEPDATYMKLHAQEKDQISWYYIPYSIIVDRPSNIIHEFTK